MTDRLEHYEKAYNSETVAAAYDATKADAVAKQKIALVEQVDIEIQVKKLVQGEPLIHIPYYIIFGKEIVNRSKRHEEQTLINEIEILQKKWMARGLNKTFLDLIKVFFIEAYKIWDYFRLDISLLDGNDRLS